MERTILEPVLEQIRKSGKKYDEEKIIRAYNIAYQAHVGQNRVSGELYICHPVEVAKIIIELGLDTDSVISALLHDVVEDTAIPISIIKKEFGPDVANMVDGVTKLGKIPLISQEQQKAENLRKMLIAMSDDIRVVIIKLADRLHNMRTMECMKEQKRRDKSLETMEIYAPIAHRLGIRGIKEELEDLSLKFLDPDGYEHIEKMVELKKEERQEFLNKIKAKIQERLAPELPKINIEGRVKSTYGIYRKVCMQGRAFDEIYDIYAIRIIVNSVFECYNVLGVIHDMFRPLPNRFKDYISTPKQNMYQSLHTTVVDKEATPFEVQIRTWDMHYTSEYGIAAHWRYKEGITDHKDKLNERLAWVRQLLETGQESQDAEEILRSIKSDIAPEEVFVFTPKGDVISLPAGSTIIDFAYAIHTAVGNRMTGAKVDGRMVALSTEVKTGMIIQILTSSTENGPSRDWLKIVRTTEARNKIRSWYKKEKREENIQYGKIEFERELKRNFISLTDAEKNSFMQSVAERQKYITPNDFYAAIGYGGVILSRVMPGIKDFYMREHKNAEKEENITKIVKEKTHKASNGVLIEGVEGCLVKFSQCCSPVSGDEIIGFITRGYGVSIHQKDCVNVVNAIDNTQYQGRWVSASWSNQKNQENFKSTVDIFSQDRPGLIADVSILLNNMHIPIHSLMAKEAGDEKTRIQISISTSDITQLSNIIDNIRKVAGVLEIKRLAK